MVVALRRGWIALSAVTAAPIVLPFSPVFAQPVTGYSGVPPVVLAQAENAKPEPAKPAEEIKSVAPVASPKFEIRRYLIEGNTLLPQDAIARTLAPFTGPNKDFGEVQRALEALQTTYQRVGYGSVEVRLPEQELENGEVRFVVIEVKVGKIAVEGNQHFSSANIRRSVPSLREGFTPNSLDIAASIKVANENPSKQSAVLLKGAEQEGQVDAVIRVADVLPVRWSVSLDNTGNENTGRWRMGLAYQHSNLFDRDHILTTQFIFSPTNINDVNVYGVGYKIPLYGLGDSIDIVAGYSKVDSGTVQDLFLVSGQGAVYGFRYNQGLPKWNELDQKLVYGLDYRAYQNLVTPEGSQDNLVPDITVHPVSVTYSANARLTAQEIGFYLNAAQNIPGGNDGRDEDFKQQGARFGVGSASYRLYRAGLNYVRAFQNDWQFRTNLSAQYTKDALVSPEQFGIGGADNVRGFAERYVANDKGYRTTLEVYGPDVAKPLKLPETRLRFLLFYDTGHLMRNHAQANELESASLDSGGMGLRWNYKTHLSARLDVAHVFHDGTGFQGTDGRRNINKLHLSLAWVW